MRNWSILPSLSYPQDKQYVLYDTPIECNWPKDPSIACSYSGYSTSAAEVLDEVITIDGITYKSLFTPINNHLFFAGEHTTTLGFIGTMEAAVESGERIAKAITKQHGVG